MAAAESMAIITRMPAGSGMRRQDVGHHKEECHPILELTVDAAPESLRMTAAATTDVCVRSTPSFGELCRWGDATDLRRVVLRLINETARHAGHTHAAGELPEGVTREGRFEYLAVISLGKVNDGRPRSETPVPPPDRALVPSHLRHHQRAHPSLASVDSPVKRIRLNGRSAA